MQHSTFICNPHLDCDCGCPPCLGGNHAACLGGEEMPCGGCRCEPKIFPAGADAIVEEGLWCNPYSVEGFCPTNGRGDECLAEPDRWGKIPVAGGGFTFGLKGEDDG